MNIIPFNYRFIISVTAIHRVGVRWVGIQRFIHVYQSKYMIISPPRLWFCRRYLRPYWKSAQSLLPSFSCERFCIATVALGTKRYSNRIHKISTNHSSYSNWSHHQWRFLFSFNLEFFYRNIQVYCKILKLSINYLSYYVYYYFFRVLKFLFFP